MAQRALDLHCNCSKLCQTCLKLNIKSGSLFATAPKIVPHISKAIHIAHYVLEAQKCDVITYIPCNLSFVTKVSCLHRRRIFKYDIKFEPVSCSANIDYLVPRSDTDSDWNVHKTKSR